MCTVIAYFFFFTKLVKPFFLFGRKTVSRHMYSDIIKIGYTTTKPGSSKHIHMDKTEHTHPGKVKNTILTEPPTRLVAGDKNGAYPFKKPKPVQKRSIAVQSVGDGQKNNQKRSIAPQFDFVKS